jgi:hypothetical protein
MKHLAGHEETSGNSLWSYAVTGMSPAMESLQRDKSSSFCYSIIKYTVCLRLLPVPEATKTAKTLTVSADNVTWVAYTLFHHITE